MTEKHKAEFGKLAKKYRILKTINTFLMSCAIFLLILIILEVLNILDIPFYEHRLPISHRIFLNTWVGIPYVLIEKRMKKIDNRIREIESMYEKKSHENRRRQDDGSPVSER